ncbi:2-C-methyl-D-erythritol 4-phosphate cytidylyltransferase [Chlamydia abortus]|uniref:2-C-methyl-D-erythritol 4-phosphate cytidylyltransferase n=1 Tax=Chlamydia abortus TaxID=83555 RepID=UPI000917E678|nr:2-C-methyl-D-erythritol 4-phosphate cytidylyltransferase [Chlamydia abortus]SGA01062.1 2-C-methyl-D-erythritol 4-phosphate cytidylyltransferase [Chlamydia abortus]SGA07005.1 2-C-methyl-D-erythritol 4-phosphate cytidylyltransferase [Chlamydia abortus]SGA16813.1 2-C-methyl-D-erythritol 4-phosphate cytidylyltransferase [Chlamydia abortus]SHD81537.1 2-C-methyl-D-erythritol 4-phosphate cytidylyltransferase [Chlamydia abortus]SHN94424.1 2-C-methyl-D-erythritol 4-phosphate cytidylyltransferase [Ch
MDPKCSLILLSGGKGERFGANQPKQYLPFRGEPLILHALNMALRIPEISEIIVVCDVNYESIFEGYPVKFARPGTRRQDSVFSGLQQVANPWVLVHDGVRPFIYPDEVTELVSAAYQTGAATLVSNVPYTIKQRDPVKTLDRDALSIVHTPQCIKTQILLEGLERANQERITLVDDTQAAELLNLPVALVFNKHPQIKVTYPEDLTLAHALL